jgi:hypothetical protein
MTSHFAELRAKYEEMRALRADALADEPRDPKTRLSALAARFPGALREIDELAMDEIDARIHALAAAERDPDSAARWMHAMTRFHALARGALFVKRSLASDESHDAWPDEARAWRDDLHRIARPPRGRLMDLVYERLARELATTPRDAKKLVFTSSRK